MGDYTVVRVDLLARRLAGRLAIRRPDEVVALDTEVTTRFDPKRSLPYLGDRATAVSLCFRDRAYVVAPEVARPVVEAAAAGRTIMHNSQFDRAVLATSFGVEFDDRLVYDTLTGAFLLDESCDKRLKEGLGVSLFGYDAAAEKRDLDAFKRGRTVEELYRERREFVGRLEPAADSRAWARREAEKSRRTWSDLTVHDEVFARYAAQDACLTMAVYEHQMGEIHRHAGGPTDVTPAVRPAMDITGLCYRLGRVGMRADADRAASLAAVAATELGTIEADFDGVDLNSHPQLARLLYDTWELPCTRRTKTGAPSTDEIALRRLAWHEGVGKLLRFRELDKLLHAFYEPILRLVGTDGRIHPSYACARTDTGRLSCSSPNVQQLPADDAAGVRAIFVADPGMELVEYDLGQIEFRLAAAIAGETTLVDKFVAGVDPYLELAEILGVERKLAKRVSLAAIYGMRARKLAQTLAEGSGAEPDVAAADRILTAFWRTYPAIAACMTRTAALWQRQGYLAIPAAPGRFRRWWNTLEGHPEPTHKAFNALIQGGAAELLKRILLAFEPVVAAYGRIVATVHDSIVAEVEPGAGAVLKPALEAITADLSGFAVPLVWEMKPWPTAGVISELPAHTGS